MFGFSFRSLAEAAISTLTGPKKNDEDLSTLIEKVKKQQSVFLNIESITKEIEKQLGLVVETNSSILRQMKVLDDNTTKNNTSVDVWENASRFYCSVGDMKDALIPTITSEILSIRNEIASRCETLHDLEGLVILYNKKQQSIADDEDLVNQLKIRVKSLSSTTSSDQEELSDIVEQISTMNESIATDESEQEKEKLSLLSRLNELFSSNQDFVDSSLSQLYQIFSSMFLTISQTFSSEIPDSILSLKQPLIENQVDNSLHFTLSAGSTYDHAISMTKGSLAKWLFSCYDNTVRFSVAFTNSQTRESVIVEEEHRVKGDGRYDLGEYHCDELGVLTLIWDNTYSLLSSRDVNLRLAVKHPKQEVHHEENPSEKIEQVTMREKEQVKVSEAIQQQKDTPLETVSIQDNSLPDNSVEENSSAIQNSDVKSNEEESTSSSVTESVQPTEETFSPSVMAAISSLQPEEILPSDVGFSEVVHLPKEVEGLLDD